MTQPGEERESLPGRVLGVGIDLCELDRIASVLNRLGDTFLCRAYSPDEIAFIQSRPDRVRAAATLFAGKEAVVKCLGTGFSAGVGWKQVEVLPADSGWRVRLNGEAHRRASTTPHSFSLDLRCTQQHALAVALWSEAPVTDEERATG